VPAERLQGHDSEDILKEYLSRGTYAFPPAEHAADRRHDRLHRRARPEWNPINICSYHLQEAGATPIRRSPTR